MDACNGIEDGIDSSLMLIVEAEVNGRPCEESDGDMFTRFGTDPRRMSPFRNIPNRIPSAVRGRISSPSDIIVPENGFCHDIESDVAAAA